eukprot:COSAG01_NODE_5168_length_4438_cov_4.333026_3_plen_77_part_00
MLLQACVHSWSASQVRSDPSSEPSRLPIADWENFAAGATVDRSEHHGAAPTVHEIGPSDGPPLVALVTDEAASCGA